MRRALSPWLARAAGLALLASLLPPALLLAQRLRQQPVVAAAAPLPAPAKPPSDLGAILAAAPFGIAAALPDAADSPPLVLLGVTVAADPAASRAILATGDGGPAASYRPGDPVAAGVRLAAVAPDGVTLDVQGQAVDLGFPEAAPATVPATAPATAPVQAPIDFSGMTP
jgi:hypothetical protein